MIYVLHYLDTKSAFCEDLRRCEVMKEQVIFGFWLASLDLMFFLQQALLVQFMVFGNQIIVLRQLNLNVNAFSSVLFMLWFFSPNDVDREWSYSTISEDYTWGNSNVHCMKNGKLKCKYCGWSRHTKETVGSSMISQPISHSVMRSPLGGAITHDAFRNPTQVLQH